MGARHTGWVSRRANKPTVYDVAERAGVSIATVSFTYQQPDRVRESTRETVLRAARELGYVPNASARGLAYGKTGAFGLYAFDLLLERAKFAPAPLSLQPESPDDIDVTIFPLYVDEVQRGFELACWHLGRTLLLSTGSDGGSVKVADVAGRVDGLAVFPGSTPAADLEIVAKAMPVVAFSRVPEVGSLHYVTVDNAGGMTTLVGHLLETHGYRDLAFVGELALPDLEVRFAAFEAALEHAGLPAQGAPIGADGEWEDELREQIRTGRLPRALVCSSDQLALSVLRLLEGEGVDVPGRVAVTGFDGILAGRLVTPSLTTIRQPMERMGRIAARILEDAVGADPKGAQPHSERLDVSLVVRESCGCAPAKLRSGAVVG